MNTLHHKIRVVSCCLGLLLAVGLVLVTMSAQAGHIGEREVRAAVETWVRYVTADARPDAVVERMEPYQVEGETVAYIVHLKGGGFCLAGADDLLLPVYLYSPYGTYDPNNPDYQYILEEIGARLKAVRKGLAERDPQLQAYQNALTERADYWQTLIAGRMPEAAAKPNTLLTAPISMTLPLTSKWDQGSPYYDQLPDLRPNERTVVGCNGTATAQIMYYWKWPPSGSGNTCVNYDYRWRTDWISTNLTIAVTVEPMFTNRLHYVYPYLAMNGYWDDSVYSAAQAITNATEYQNALTSLWGLMNPGTKAACADFGNTTYQWGTMRDIYTAGQHDPGALEVAKLSAHVSIGVSTTLGVSGSNSYFGNAVNGLKNYFRYDPDAKFDAQAYTYDLIWEIQWLRPAGLGGSKKGDGGHAWVVYGYNQGVNPPEFAMNMGWSGNGDNWYTFDTVPFPQNHDMMRRIAPLNVKFVGALSAGDGSPNDPYQNIETAIATAPDGATLIFRAGSVNTFSASPLVINRPLTLKGWDVTITR